MGSKPILVTGSTGYVRGRLVPKLLENGHRIRVMGRSLSKLQCRPWAAEPGIEMAQADVMDFESLKKAAEGCRAVYYLVHSMGHGTTELQQLSRFLPRGIFGIIYWYSLYPFHKWIFKGMLRGIGKARGRPISIGPQRFAPRMQHMCNFDPRK